MEVNYGNPMDLLSEEAPLHLVLMCINLEPLVVSSGPEF